MEPTITITLKLGEPIAVEVSGVQGTGCKALTKPLESWDRWSNSQRSLNSIAKQ
jgi:hypothetical protein